MPRAGIEPACLGCFATKLPALSRQILQVKLAECMRFQRSSDLKSLTVTRGFQSSALLLVPILQKSVLRRSRTHSASKAKQNKDCT